MKKSSILLSLLLLVSSFVFATSSYARSSSGYTALAVSQSACSYGVGHHPSSKSRAKSIAVSYCRGNCRVVRTHHGNGYGAVAIAMEPNRTCYLGYYMNSNSRSYAIKMAMYHCHKGAKGRCKLNKVWHFK